MELLGFQSFNELNRSDMMHHLEFEEKSLVIKQPQQEINANFTQHEMVGQEGKFYLVALKDIKINKMKTTTPTTKLTTNYKTIYLDVHKIAEEIGLSVSDYKLYLDSFIDQSIIDEKRLLEGNDKVVKNLSNLALTLKIPHINILLLKIQKLSHKERMPLIDEYYTKLALLTLEKPEDYEEDELQELLVEENLHTERKEEVLDSKFTDLLSNVIDEPLVEFQEDFFKDEIEDKGMNNTTILEKELKTHSDVAEISFDNVTPLPISYSPQTAADELNLPVVLIEEFVDDFVEQARQDKDHLLASYYQKDMDNIHELGHKLKGAASNLRINELSDILEEIQFCTEHEKLEGLFKEYWGHFLSLEDYMKQLKRA
jgi:HPt (histidine-containing phosphotransfer) domain-containing protein